MKRSLLIGLSIIIVYLTSCSKDYELQKTVFIPDPDFPELPVYSEWGYNTFGAYYDRQPFVSVDNLTPLKVEVRDDTTFFRFHGKLDYSNDMTMFFFMTDFYPATYDELVQLEGKTIDLEDAHYGVFIKIDGVKQAITLLNGTLEFKKAQNLIVDKNPEEVILSGVFQFQVVVDDEPFTISRGRFDMGICYDNFYRY